MAGPSSTPLSRRRPPVRSFRAVRRAAALVLGLALAVSLAACRGGSSAAPEPQPAPSVSGIASPQPSRPAQVTPVPCDDASGFDCDFQDRFAAVTAYVTQRPGVVGVVVHDRLTGATWSNADAGTYIWTASSIKLAIAVNLLQRNRSGDIELSDEDYEQMSFMLTESDNFATDYLWSTYGQLPSEAYVDHGLPDLEATYDEVGVWGYELATATAMSGLVDFALTELDDDDRDWLVDQLRGVVEDQRWGLLGLDDGNARPGAKNGWDQEDTGWVVNSVGFVGPRQRYTVAIMNDLGATAELEPMGLPARTDEPLTPDPSTEAPPDEAPSDEAPSDEAPSDEESPPDEPDPSDDPPTDDTDEPAPPDGPYVAGFDDGVETVSMVAQLLFAGRF